MIALIVGFVVLLLGLFALALQRFYSSVPAKELKRLAARGDHLAAALYSPVAYGPSLRVFLWLVFALGVAGGSLIAMYNLVTWVAFVVMAVTMLLVVWLLSVQLTVHSARLAVTAAPALRYILFHIHPILKISTKLFARRHIAHSGLYEKEDVIALLNQQKEQADNRIRHAELELMSRAAQFDDIHAADIVLPWNQAKQVSVNDHIGPVLLGELHASGQNSFVVYDEAPEHPVGTLFLRDAVHAKAGGRVGDLMHSRVCFVHEDFSLRQVLSIFVQTGQFVVVVVNSFEEAVGIITLKALLLQLVGETPEEELPCEDRTSVAAFKPQLIPEPVEVPVTLDEPLDSPSPDEPEMVK